MVLLLNTNSVAVAKLAVAKLVCTCLRYPHSAGYLTRRTLALFTLYFNLLFPRAVLRSLEFPLFSGEADARRLKLLSRRAHPRGASSRRPVASHHPLPVAGRWGEQRREPRPLPCVSACAGC